MIRVDENNIEEVEQFVLENLKRSGFIYGNLHEDSSKSFILKKDGKILAMANTISDRYCTYLFPKETNENIIREVIDFMKTQQHLEGTVVGDYFEIFAEYYDLPQNAINEVATLELEENSYQSRQAIYISTEDVEAYKEALDSITEFTAKKEIDELKENFERSQIVAIKENEKIISSACLSAISDKTAVVTCVFTRKQYEGKGYAKDCLYRLLQDYGTGRTISIFFTNPSAKKLYLSLGFEVEEKLIMFKKPKMI